MRRTVMLGKHRLVVFSVLILMALSMLLAVRPAQAQTYSVLYTFCSQTQCNGDGWLPNGRLVLDAQGNLYGTTLYGGGSGCGGIGCGTVFEVTQTGTETAHYRFGGGQGGGEPNDDLVRDGEGNLYGTTEIGGKPGGVCPVGCGTVFEITSSGNETVLHSFGPRMDGFFPTSGLVQDSEGNLYGTTGSGGAYGAGTVYEITAAGTEKVLYNFNFCSVPNCGPVLPQGSLVLDAESNLYGITTLGGRILKCFQGCGTVFELNPD